MKKLWILMLLALLLTGCAREDQSADWDACRLEDGDPKVYAFEMDGLWGLADADKRVLIDAKFVSMEHFRGDYAVCSYLDYSAEPTDISGYLEFYENEDGTIRYLAHFIEGPEMDSLFDLDGDILSAYVDPYSVQFKR